MKACRVIPLSIMVVLVKPTVHPRPRSSDHMLESWNSPYGEHTHPCSSSQFARFLLSAIPSARTQ